MKKYLPYILIALSVFTFLLFVSQKLFVSGNIYHTDVTGPFDTQNLYQKYFFTFSNDIGESLAEKARIPIFSVIYGVFSVLTLGSVDDSYYVKTKIYLLIGITLISFIIFAKKLLDFFSKQRDNNENYDLGAVLIPALVGAFFYVLNYWTVNRIVHFGLFFTTVSILITFYLTYTYFFSRERKIEKLLVLALLLAIFTPTPHTILFELIIMVAIIIPFLVVRNVSMSTKIARLRSFGMFGGLYLLTNLYWILPYAVARSSPDAVLSKTIVDLLGRYATLPNALKLMGYWYVNPKNYYIEGLEMIQNIIAFIPLVITIVGLWAIRKAKGLTLILVIILTTGAFLSTASKVTNAFYYYIMFDSPLKSFGWILREYDKFGLLLAFVYSTGMVLLLHKVYKNKVVFSAVLFVIAVVLWSNFTYFNRDFTKRYTPVIIPSEFEEVNTLLSGDSQDFNTVWYPGVPKPFWAGNDEVRFVFTNINSSKPAVTTSSWMINYASYILDDDNVNYINVGKALDYIGAKYLIIRNDESTFPDRNLEDNLSIQNSLEKVYNTPILSVYKNKEYTGLAKFYVNQISTNYGRDGLKNPYELESNSKNTLINYLDKPAHFTKINTVYDVKDSHYFDAVTAEFKDRFIFPYNSTTEKDDGNAGSWKLGSLEDLTHAETHFFFDYLGLNSNQFDYSGGVAVARDGWTRKSGSQSLEKQILPTFSSHNNVLIDDDYNLFYSSVTDDFKYYWNIVRSDKFDVSNTRALEIKLSSNINASHIPHYKIYTYDSENNILNTTFIYADERDYVDAIVKIPENAKYADFSIWTLSDEKSSYDYDIYRLRINDISNNVEAPKLEFTATSKCFENCHILARILKSQIGGKIQISVDKVDYFVETKTANIEEALSEDEGMFTWVDIGTMLNLGKKVHIKLVNLDGFNAVNAILPVSEAELSERRPIASEVARQNQDLFTPEFASSGVQLKVSQVNPTKYQVTVEGAGGESGVLAFAKPFNTSWVLRNEHNARPQIVNGYINGWEIDSLKNGVYTIEYYPQRFFYYGSAISILIALGILTYIFIKKPRS